MNAFHDDPPAHPGDGYRGDLDPYLKSRLQLAEHVTRNSPCIVAVCPSISLLSWMIGRVFSLERLLAIFYSILMDEARPSAELLSQITCAAMFCSSCLSSLAVPLLPVEIRDLFWLFAAFGVSLSAIQRLCSFAPTSSMRVLPAFPHPVPCVFLQIPLRPRLPALSESDPAACPLRGLEQLGLLSRAGGDALSPRYRCQAPYALVRAVADTLAFDLSRYLAD